MLAGNIRFRRRRHFLQGKKQLHVLHLMPNLQEGAYNQELFVNGVT